MAGRNTGRGPGQNRKPGKLSSKKNGVIQPERTQLNKERQYFIRWLFQNPISFTTSDGSRVRILRHAIGNMYKGEKTPPRPMVIVMVGKEIMGFYKSSGESSQLPGEWFPTKGTLSFMPDSKTPIDEARKVIKKDLLIKMPGHSNSGNPTFLPWVTEVANQIKKAEAEKKIDFQGQWDAYDWLMIKKMLGKISLVRKKTG